MPRKGKRAFFSAFAYKIDTTAFCVGGLLCLCMFFLLFLSIGTPGATLVLVSTAVAVFPGGIFCLGETIAHTLCGGILGLMLSDKTRGREPDKCRSAFFVLLHLIGRYLWYFFFFGKMLFLISLLFAFWELFFCTVSCFHLKNVSVFTFVLMIVAGLGGLYHLYLSVLSVFLL